MHRGYSCWLFPAYCKTISCSDSKHRGVFPSPWTERELCFKGSGSLFPGEWWLQLKAGGRRWKPGFQRGTQTDPCSGHNLISQYVAMGTALLLTAGLTVPSSKAAGSRQGGRWV